MAGWPPSKRLNTSGEEKFKAMNELKKILVCAMSVSLIGMFFGCEQDSDLNSGDAGLQVCDDAGYCVDVDASVGGGGGTGGTAGGGGAGGQPPSAQADWVWVHIEDTSETQNTKGTPGADICGVTFDCGARGTGNGVEAKLERGNGDICKKDQNIGGSNCSADRDDPNAAVGAVDPCEPGSSPSEYVSLGIGGTLKVRVDTDPEGLLDSGGLGGCAVTVTELVGSDDESYQISVCSEEAADGNCYPFAGPVAAPGGGVGVLDNIPTP